MIHWPTFLARIELRFPMPIRLRFQGGAVIWAFCVCDYRDGAARWFDSVPVPVPETSDPEYAFRWVRYWTQVCVLHELDETLYLDGCRPHDPHRSMPLPRWDT